MVPPPDEPPKEWTAKTATPARPRRRRGRVRLWAGFLVPLALLVVLSLALNGTLTLLDPATGVWTAASTAVWGNNTFTLSGLEHPVTVTRDGAGITHIYAQDDEDLFFAQGYTEASDRLFQIEAQSLLAEGNLSGWIGSSAITSDETIRLLGFPGEAASIIRTLPTVDPSGLADLQSFSDGINAYITYAESTNTLPLEFKALGIRPVLSTPYMVMCFDRLEVYAETSGIVEPLLAGSAASLLGDAAVNQIEPVYPPYTQNLTEMPGNGSLDGQSLSAQGISPAYVFEQDWLAPWATGVPASLTKTLGPLYRDAIQNLTDPYIATFGPAPGVGSNSWVVGANRSATGHPLLANDPHITLQLPSVWLLDELVDPNYDAEGYALAGVPGILVGHDPTLAWGLTDAEGAQALDYVEQLQGNDYFSNGTWHAMTSATSIIPVAGGAGVPQTIWYTNNGPLVARVGDWGVSVLWEGANPTYEGAVELQMDRAATIAQFEDDLKEWGVPALNFILAEDNDTTGVSHIGVIVAGGYPLVHEVLPDGQSLDVVGSRSPLNGSGAFEPAGNLPFDLHPQALDPAQGYLLAPNQPTAGTEFPNPFVGSWWDSGGRAATINASLAAAPHETVDGMEALQANLTDAWAVDLKPDLQTALAGVATAAGATAAERTAATTLSPVISGWNGSFPTGSVAATVYTYWMGEIVNTTWTAISNEADLSVAGVPFSSAYLWLSENDPNSTWFPGGWTAVSTGAAVSALGLLIAKLGPDTASWTWGSVHSLTIPSITGIGALAEGPYPWWGDDYTVSRGPYNTSLTVPLGVNLLSSSMRQVVEVGAVGSPAWDVLPGGESGDPASPYYANLLPLWLGHEYVSGALTPTPSSPDANGLVSTWELDP